METPITITRQSSLFFTTEQWHSSLFFMLAPPAISLLAAQVLPEVAGDTMFASQYPAYEALSEGMQRPCYTGYERGTEVHPTQRKCEAVEIAHGTGRGTAMVYTATKKAGVNDAQFI